ncbi:hypothetical protein [Streptomyces sp. SID12488]|nr:hypothetical protein [Streptomyces sp. SID12488]
MTSSTPLSTEESPLGSPTMASVMVSLRWWRPSALAVSPLTLWSP